MWKYSETSACDSVNAAKELLQRGKAYLQADQKEKARECFREGFRLAPSDDELQIFCHGFRYFDAGEYIKRHPEMEPFEAEYLQLHTDPEDRREYFLRFFDGSVYVQDSGKDTLVSRKDYVVDEHRCDRCIEIIGGLPDVSVYAPDAPGGLRAAAHAQYLFSRDKEKRFQKDFYTTWHYTAEKRSIIVVKNTRFGPSVQKRKVSFPETDVCPYDVIAGTCKLHRRAAANLLGESFPPSLLVAPDPAIAALIREYYPR